VNYILKIGERTLDFFPIVLRLSPPTTIFLIFFSGSDGWISAVEGRIIVPILNKCTGLKIWDEGFRSSSLKLHTGLWNVGHRRCGVSKLSTNVHAEGSRSLTETVSFRSVFPSVADLAKQAAFVFSNADTVEQLVAHVAFETLLVPFGTGGYSFFRGINGLAAARAFGSFWHSERHGDG